jgi:hypothetical protein
MPEATLQIPMTTTIPQPDSTPPPYSIGPCPPPPHIIQQITQGQEMRTARDVSMLYYEGFYDWLLATMENYVFLEGFIPTHVTIEDVTSYQT